MEARSDLMIKNLPALYQEQEALATFLRPFESILLGGRARQPHEGPGLREIILDLPALLDPMKTDENFLPWLASWLALNLRAELPAERSRLLIAHAASLFAWRGTSKGLEDLLSIVTGGGTATIVEPEVFTLTVGIQAIIGSSTRLGRDLPFFFEVSMLLPGPEPIPESVASLEALIRDTIDLGKPAHTYYKLGYSFADSTTVPIRPSASNTITARESR